MAHVPDKPVFCHGPGVHQLYSPGLENYLTPSSSGSKLVKLQIQTHELCQVVNFRCARIALAIVRNCSMVVDVLDPEETQCTGTTSRLLNGSIGWRDDGHRGMLDRSVIDDTDSLVGAAFA